MKHSRWELVISLVLGVAVSLGVLVTGVQAQSGSLEPPPSAVDPFGSGNPVPTTQTQPSWDQNLPAAERFVRVLPTASVPFGAAVLDRETGVVWESVVRTTTHIWVSARGQCINRTVGNKRGWRLPSVHELASLVDLTNPGGNPDIPAGAPFIGVSSFYWSATTIVDNPTDAWVVDFFDGIVKGRDKSFSLLVWCVRGGMNADAY